jgi:hypothetical protein
MARFKRHTALSQEQSSTQESGFVDLQGWDFLKSRLRYRRK